MKAIILVMRNLPANGMAIFPFILVKSDVLKKDLILINHEKIHLKQQLELLILPFYLIYLVNYLVNLLRYKNHYQAYVNISFEREAYLFEQDLNYLNKRKNLNWLKFLRSNKVD